MKYVLLIPLLATLFVANSYAQERIYRCGNEYTNTVPNAQTRGCKLVAGGNVTVVQGTRPAASTPARAAATSTAAPSGGQRVDAGEQKSRDSDARRILESELKKAEARQAELLKEYNNGEPEKIGGEARNYQKYLDRVAELKASLARNESDIAGIRRELGRVPAAAAAK
ncbi:MAG: hypothetical protein HHJ15_08515 [Rhodoferax sp.]|uniref:hypothetical protein n=1 Tax=Rhodoferax sp. TaxID=50421 RepID=UPI0017E5E768|nr:hypothetical protein [Rhodoferax sp.]NMM19973.1 hypothetical protein [Rhodoferax sp.]